MTPPSWVAYAARALEREQRRDDPEPEPEGEITTQSALDGIAEVARILRERRGL